VLGLLLIAAIAIGLYIFLKRRKDSTSADLSDFSIDGENVEALPTQDHTTWTAVSELQSTYEGTGNLEDPGFAFGDREPSGGE
jgi:hypothetical protein